MNLNPYDVKLADDQDRYPGWYRTPDGGWVRPDSGEYYSPGSSPPAAPIPIYPDQENFDLTKGGLGVVPTAAEFPDYNIG